MPSKNSGSGQFFWFCRFRPERLVSSNALAPVLAGRHGSTVTSPHPNLRRLLALVLALALLPGWAELAENVEHLLHDGHLAHSEAHEFAQASEVAHEATDEHGCTPVSHHCDCHTSVPGVLNEPDRAVAHSRVAVDEEPLVGDGRLLERAQAPPTRPPIA